LFPGVIVENGTLIENSIVMSNSHVGENCHLDQCIISEDVRIYNNVTIGQGDNLPNADKPNIYNSGITVVGEGAEIPEGTTIGKNVMVDMDARQEDFCSSKICSGASVYKGGICE
jgi:glucose-1-phosphate adenylyltransferase